MQLVGARFTEASAIFGNDLSTFPSYPAEIRAPAGSLGGVSGFQVQFGNASIIAAEEGKKVFRQIALVLGRE